MWGMCGRRMRRRRGGETRECGPGTYSNEREGAFRIDSDAIWLGELGAGADAIVEALAAAGERGCLLALEVDLPDAVVVSVLRCGGHASQGECAGDGKSGRVWSPCTL